MTTGWPKRSASSFGALIDDKPADIGDERDGAGLGIDDAGHAHDDALRPREIEAFAGREPQRNFVHLAQNMGAAAPIGRFGDFGDRLADEIGDRKRDLRAPEIDADGQGGVVGEIVADRRPPDSALGDPDGADPAFGFEVGDDERHRLLGKSGRAGELGPRQGRPVKQDLRDQAPRILLRERGGLLRHMGLLWAH